MIEDQDPGEHNAALATFCQQLASATPTPGGGSAAAAAAAMGAAMVQMAIEFSLPRAGPGVAQDQLRQARDECAAARARALTAVDEDARAYQLFADANSLPRKTDLQREKRRVARASAAKASAATSAEIVEVGQIVQRAGEMTVAKGHRHLLNDAGGGARLGAVASAIALANLNSNLAYCPTDGQTAEWTDLAATASLALREITLNLEAG